ncbi:DivIVA domain-containing protein [Mycoplasmoides genitalium]|uniref:Uncharacterized protein MG211 n=1 Tax=Mycoplasma genitalium (strain ATCC 33530 / DSM 19775 / NCTC 10195 / G37) TaxID=243273 RepID=Y211_MYCGE|nr:DivIVA domain-containing protein [Mycoplasmoides genitalium]P47453.1 RecName: Full=Uncharacterized protein MG211 [Mycoplasmoides genitalium G37]ABY79664.1 conserved hypothetical protein [synthetic Mycoplasma genitalium JCVI-1.0]AAC71430.1 conserved hypothetical protein [Mycoplasmoides genitalium G37]AFQ03042.1 hypothetical protein CM9_01240 [Mycoplasmoides genitalium M2321]AFQ03530.1 hypothetical protein CM3_01335 [Mycoplasmoides genitalium M6282]AFQ04532.1 hypothetical protein CM5_01230 [
MDNKNPQKLITSELLANHRFNFAKDDKGGYDANEVDAFLDQLTKTLIHYEEMKNNEQELKNAYDKLFSDRDQILSRCAKLEADLNTFYENGYANKVLINRVQELEDKLEKLPDRYTEKLERIEKLLKKVIKHWTDGEDISNFEDEFF